MNKNDYDILFLIRYLNKCLQQDLDDNLKQYDLTSTQGRVVFFVYYRQENGENTTPADLMERFSLSKSTVSELIDRLVNKNLVNKIIDKNRIYITATDYSKDFVHAFEKVRNKTKDNLIDGFDDIDIEKIKKDIYKMIKNIKGDDSICGSK